MDTATRVQIMDETDCISHITNTLGKGMNPIILPPAMGKIVGQTKFFILGEATSLGEGKFKPVKLCLKIDLESYPVRVGGVNMSIENKSKLSLHIQSSFIKCSAMYS